MNNQGEATYEVPEHYKDEYEAAISGKRTFVKSALYDERGDCVTYVAADKAYNAEWIAPFLTLYFDVRSGGVLGFKLKCVRAINRIMKDGGNPLEGVQLKDVIERALEAWKNNKKLGGRRIEWEQERQVLQLLRSDLAEVLVGPELAKAA